MSNKFEDMAFKVETVTVVAKTRKLKATYTLDPYISGINVGKSVYEEQVISQVCENSSIDKHDEIVARMREQEKEKNPTIAVYAIEPDEKLIHFAGRYHKVKK